MKRGLLGFPLLIFLVQAASAQFFSGYGRFSLGDFFNSIDPETMTILSLFLVFFIILFYAFSRVFKDQYRQPNKGLSGGLAGIVSLGITYGIYRSGFNLGDLFYGFGIGTETLYLIVLIAFIFLAIVLIRKIKFHGFLMVFGLLFILLTIFTELFYEKGAVRIISIVLFLFGFLLWWKRRKRRRKLTGYNDYGPSPQGPSRFSQRKERKREFRNMKYEQKLNYERQKAEKEYQRRLYDEEVIRRAKNIKRIKGRREKKEGKKQKEFQKEEKQSRKEERRRQQALEAQQQIQQLNDKIMELERKIPGASVIDRNKIEDQVRDYQKRVKKLRKFLR